MRTLFLYLISFSVLAFEGAQMPQPMEALEFTILPMDVITEVQLKGPDDLSFGELDQSFEIPSSSESLGPLEDPLSQAKVAQDILILGLSSVESILEFLEKRQPEIMTKNEPLSFVPADQQGLPVSPFLMSNWSRPVKKSYQLVFKNLYGWTMAKVIFSPKMNSGGKYQGSGSYLTGVEVSDQVFAGWTIKIETKSELSSVTNTGPVENPVVSAVVNYTVKVSSYVTKHQYSYSFYFSGDGTLELL
ncbi:MAG: hypothetical protein HOE90_05470 [Bacteriovoracaceae bacterium]|jgi:hypothetical protein|nr:hypothetical protein [Bacteriovoracaceae bacterium]